MSIFGEYLYQLIQKRGISISGLSRESGVERTAIHKALNGERILPYPAVEALAGYLKLSPEETRRLRQYYGRLFESENMTQARGMIDRIFSKWAEMPDIMCKRERGWEEPRPEEMRQSGFLIPETWIEKNVWNGYAEITGLICAMMAEEIKCANPRMELAIPPQVLAVRECIEELYSGGTDMEIHHLLCFDISETNDECNLHNLESLGCVLPSCILSEGRYHVYYYYNNEGQARYTDPLPYFLVTHRGAVCFSENCQTAILLKEKEQVDYFKSCFYHLKKSCHRLAEYREEGRAVAELFGSGEPSGDRERHSNRKRDVCIIMSQPYLKNIQQRRILTIFTGKGIRDFLDTGRLYDLVEGAAEIESIEMRHEILQKFIASLAEDKTRGRMVDEMAFALPERIVILLSASRGMFLKDRDRGGGILIREGKLCHAFYEWGMYLADSEFVYDRERTLERIREITGL